MSIKGRLIKGAAANFFAMAFNQGSTLVINVVLARILGMEMYGKYSIVYSTLLAAAVLAQLAMGNTAAKYVAEYRSSDQARAGRVIGLLSSVTLMMALLGVLVLNILAPLLASRMLYAPGLAISLQIGSVFLLFYTLNGYQVGVLSGLEAYPSLAKAGMLSGIAAIASITIGALFGGVHGAVIGLSGSALIRYATHNIWVRIECDKQQIIKKNNFDFASEGSAFFSFALPAAIAGCYSWSMLWFANSFLVRQEGGYGQMAVYSAANNIRVLVLFLPNVINNVGLSVMSNERSKGNKHSYDNVFKTNLVSSSFLSIIGIVVMGLLGQSVLSVFGRDFGNGYQLLWFLLASTLFDGISMSLFQYIQTRAKIWLSLFCINIPRDGLFVAMGFLLIPRLGGLGLAIAYLGSTIIGCILHLFVIKLINKKRIGYVNALLNS